MSRPTLIHRRPPDWSRLKPLLWLVPAVFVLIAIFTTYYTVPFDSVGVVQRFGKYRATQEPGLHFKLPFGVDDVTIVPVQRVSKLEFGFSTFDHTNPAQAGEEPEGEKNMVTGDLNAVVVTWIVQYRITDPRQYLFHVREPEHTLRDLSEAVMREVVGDRTVDEVITTGRQEIETSAKERLRELASSYQLGITIDTLELKDVNPPGPVVASFNEVNKAQQEAVSMTNAANGEYNRVVPRARGEAEQKRSEAEGYRLKRVNEALGDAAAFTALLEQYLKAPTVTRTRLWLETMKEVLPTIADTWVVDADVTQLLPMVRGKMQEVGK